MSKMPVGLFVPEMSDTALKVMKKQKYLWPTETGQETPQEMFWRVASHVATAERVWNRKDELDVAYYFYDAMAQLKFMPNTPTLTNAGMENGQLAACFVLPIPDSIPEIYHTLRATSMIHTSGGGTGFSGARLRCKGSTIGKRGKTSPGSNSFLRIFNNSSKEITQGAVRHGANMWVLPVWHADIEEFIDIKKTDGEISTFNISVGITDDFMKAVEYDVAWDLRDPKDWSVVKTVGARWLMDKIIDNAWLNGDPGVLFIDTANRDNPTPGLGAFEATNPCGEQWLLPWEACTLGHINLAKMVLDGDHDDWRLKINFDAIGKMARLAVHFLDNVIEVNHFPLPEIEAMHKNGNRKIGVGVMGFADMLIQLGVPYDSSTARVIAKLVGGHIKDETDKASVELANERGSFPNFDKHASANLKRDFPNGRRNANVRTVAPTGSTSIIAGSVGGGIEPVFGLVMVRNQAGMQMYEVNPTFEAWLTKHKPIYAKEIIEYVARQGTVFGCQYMTDEEQDLFKQANDIRPDGHIQMQAAWQENVDNSISKTINMANSSTREEVREAYMTAYKTGCKGVTVYRDGSRQGQILNLTTEKKDVIKKATETLEFLAKTRLPGEPDFMLKKKSSILEDMAVDDLIRDIKNLPKDSARQITSALITHLNPKPEKIEKNVERDHVTHGTARKIPTGCGNSFIFIGRGKDGKIDDIVGKLGKSGGCASAWWEALGRLSSIALRHGASADEIRKQLSGISCHLPTMYHNSPLAKPGEKPPVITSCADALATALLEVQAETPPKTQMEKVEEVMYTTAAFGGYEMEEKSTGEQFVDTLAKGVVYNKKHMGSCPDCGSSQLDHGSGCLSCRSCGFSLC